MKSRRKKLTRRQKVYDPSKYGNSNYARKKKFLDKNGGFGFDYPDKPWKGKTVRRTK